RGRLCLLHHDDVQYLLELVKHRPDWFLDELLSLLEMNRFISVHFTTIHWELEHAGISLKKLRKVAAEQDEDLCADFVQQMSQYSADQLAFLDEVSKDERTPMWKNGCSQQGHRATMRGGVLTVDGLVASLVVYGSLKQEPFLHFLEHTVV
ncbi:hypothetical protein NEOLEDRAFT_1032120, partial [Neolentinus lepideus HHB14362 ss-1]